MARRVLREDMPQGRRVLRVQSLSRWGFDSHWYFSIELPVEGRVDREAAVLVARVTARAREAGLNRMDEVGMGKGKNSLCSWWTVADVNQDLLQDREIDHRHREWYKIMSIRWINFYLNSRCTANRLLKPGG